MEVMPRKLVLEEACNYVFVGLRRAGKSYLMFQHKLERLQIITWEEDSMIEEGGNISY